MTNLNPSGPIKQLADIPYEAVYESLPRGKFRGKTFTIAFGKDCVSPWAVGYCGGSHYFATIGEVLAYCLGRSWIGEADRETIAREITVILNSDQDEK